MQEGIVKKVGRKMYCAWNIRGSCLTQYNPKYYFDVNIFQAGDIHYCRSRGKTKCCFTNEKCEESWKSIYDNVCMDHWSKLALLFFCVKLSSFSLKYNQPLYSPEVTRLL